MTPDFLPGLHFIMLLRCLHVSYPSSPACARSSRTAWGAALGPARGGALTPLLHRGSGRSKDGAPDGGANVGKPYARTVIHTVRGSQVIPPLTVVIAAPYESRS
jgi:hypothetical protein